MKSQHTIPVLVKQWNGVAVWKRVVIVSAKANKYEALSDYRATHPEIIGDDCTQADHRWVQ
jgi:hypothetical protein